MGLGAADKQSLQLLFTYDYNAINNLVSFSERLEDDTRSRTTQSSIIELNYGLNQRWSFTGVVPFIRQTRSIQAFSGEDFTAAQGLGDLVFLIKYRIFPFEKYPNFDWIIGAGPKFPTGRTDYKNNKGLTMAADMQPGSGSFDGIFWNYFLKSRFLKIPNLGLVRVTTYRYSGENKNYNGSQTGKRQIKITETKTKFDWAELIKEIADDGYPKPDRVTLVMDNLNTNKPGALCEKFKPIEAKRILDKFKFVFMPKHSSWLNMAEIELHVLNSQCLNRRIEDMDTIISETTAWMNHRNKYAISSPYILNKNSLGT